MSIQFQGVIFAIISAIAYGMNPLGALYLYQEGLNVSSVVFYRFLFAVIILGILMIFQKKSFYITKKELYFLALIGSLFGVSALCLFGSFLYMDAGLASTILFIYPIFVAIIMSIMFKEKISIITILSIFIAFLGVVMLCESSGDNLDFVGIGLVAISSLCYAIYIVIVNKALKIPAMKLTFYSMLFCTLTILAYSFFDEKYSIQSLTTINMWFFSIFLAIVPTIISLIFLIKAINYIGSTPASILGALEPLTAVVIGVTIFNEQLTIYLSIGIVLILFGVTLIIAKDLIERKFKIKKI
ncbi:DMT family transporter [Aliarcobacter vitoriensis]|uniref:EamA family transporter n=1 Tax=Aliarcobacter vitoriensis TaxID=2011099 RepID=A0A366MT20_9BACT|nr:DMT family transporter [Aliarcobacter vitoriensis]RBQ29003.1 EamA family transporter [Aliarcobacter vitoriensis]